MGGTISPSPVVPMSFSNNFWGKDDRGVTVLLDRMKDAKLTCEELRTFYRERAAIEDEYAKRLAGLSKRAIGTSETGTLKSSLETVRKESENIATSHQNIAIQIRSELEEPLVTFTSSLRERRKIISAGIDKQLKQKANQHVMVTKSKERYEQDCQKVNSYVAQQNMLIGRELDKNNIKLEKTQLSVTTSSTFLHRTCLTLDKDYSAAVKTLYDITDRWNREWKLSCDKFQDLEEERIDFLKANLWTFANIASTVCVSDDEACEKIRTSLEQCDVEKDIMIFIEAKGTGQEIPEAPKYVNFYRGEHGDDTPYSVAQFNRQGNPQYRSRTPQPSSRDNAASSRPASTTPRQSRSNPSSPSKRTHNEYPLDGMTMYCRTPASDISSSPIPQMSSPSASSIYSQPTTVSSSSDMGRNGISKGKAATGPSLESIVERESPSKRSSRGFLKSPFRRKSKSQPKPENNRPPSPSRNRSAVSPREIRNRQPSSPEPIDPRADVMLNVGDNIFNVSPRYDKSDDLQDDFESDPIAAALAELQDVTNRAPSRQDRHSNNREMNGQQKLNKHHLPTRSVPTTPVGRNRLEQENRPRGNTLNAPPPAVTAVEMQNTTQRYVTSVHDYYNAGETRPKSRSDNRARSRSRADVDRPASRQSRPTSPAPVTYLDNDRTPGDLHRSRSRGPARSPSPRPQLYEVYRSVSPTPGHRATSPRPSIYRSASPRPSSYSQHNQQRSASPIPSDIPRSMSPGPYGPYATKDHILGITIGAGSRASDSRRQMQTSKSHTSFNPSIDQSAASRPRSRSAASPHDGCTADGRRILSYGDLIECSPLN